MNKKIAAITIMLCLASASPGLARNHSSGNNHGYYSGNHSRSNSYVYRGGGRHHDGLGVAVGIAGGLLLGSALINAASPAPPAVVYAAPYTTYQPQVIVRQPRICVEERLISGEWQINRYNGRQVWVSFPYPVSRSIEVPCY